MLRKLKTRSPTKLNKIPQNTNPSKKWWFFIYWGIYIKCPNPSCIWHLCIPTPKDRLLDVDYMCSSCRKVFKVLDIFSEEELTSMGWVRYWRLFHRGWIKKKEYRERIGVEIQKKYKAPK